MDIDTMPAGREMDRLIALLMGWSDIRVLSHSVPPYVEGVPPDIKERGLDYQRTVPHYSTDIAAAWLVWEKILPSKNIGEWMIAALWSGTTPPIITGWQIIEELYRDYETETEMIASGETAPLAICRAVLKATGYPG